MSANLLHVDTSAEHVNYQTLCRLETVALVWGRERMGKEKGEPETDKGDTQIETGRQIETEAHTGPHVSEMRKGPLCETITLESSHLRIRIWASNNSTCHLLQLCLTTQDRPVIKNVGASGSDHLLSRASLLTCSHHRWPWAVYSHSLCLSVLSVGEWSPPNRVVGTIKWLWMQVKGLEQCLAPSMKGVSTHLLQLLTPYDHTIASEGSLQRGWYPTGATWSTCPLLGAMTSNPFSATRHQNHEQDCQGKTELIANKKTGHLLRPLRLLLHVQPEVFSRQAPIWRKP